MASARNGRLLALLAASALALGATAAGSGGDGAAADTGATAAGKHFKLAARTFKMSRPDDKRRLVVRCPGNLVPYGGGMKSRPAPASDGEGAYPHSYERLGVQRGWHVTAVLFDPSHGSTRRRKVKLQVMCGRRPGHVTPPHKIKNVKPGQTRTAIARCPGRRHLIGGGFQRTDFVSRGGNYVTESRAISSKAWRVTGTAHGNFGGQMVAIAYCVRSKRPLLRTVKASTAIGPGGYGTVTTPRCPGKRRLVFGGFGTSPGGPLLFQSGFFTKRDSWTSAAYNRFGGTSTLTSYGYCLKKP